MRPGSKQRTLWALGIFLVQSILWLALGIRDPKPDVSPFGLPHGLLVLTPLGLAPIYVLVLGFAGYWLVPRRHRSTAIANWIIFIAGMSILVTIFSLIAYSQARGQGS